VAACQTANNIFHQTARIFASSLSNLPEKINLGTPKRTLVNSGNVPKGDTQPLFLFGWRITQQSEKLAA
jgi:hypothetical protein